MNSLYKLQGGGGIPHSRSILKVKQMREIRKNAVWTLLLNEETGKYTLRSNDGKKQLREITADQLRALAPLTEV